MSPQKASLANRVRDINSAALPAGGDVAAALADTRPDSPRERYVLLVIAAVPNATIEQLADMTGMTKVAVREAISCLLTDEEIYMTTIGGYITLSAAAIA